MSIRATVDRVRKSLALFFSHFNPWHRYEKGKEFMELRNPLDLIPCKGASEHPGVQMQQLFVSLKQNVFFYFIKRKGAVIALYMVENILWNRMQRVYQPWETNMAERCLKSKLLRLDHIFTQNLDLNSMLVS